MPSKYQFNKNIFLDETNNSFYLLGAYMTDGCINDKKHHLSFSLCSKDKDWLEVIKNIISPEKPIFNKLNCFTLENSNSEVMNWLISYGCKPRKSLSLKIEKDIPEQYLADFVRGLIDGDGSISISSYKKIKNNKEYFYTKTSVYLCSASIDFLNQVKNLIPISINSTLIEVNQQPSKIRETVIVPKNPFYRLQLNDSHAKKFLNWLYYPGHELSMNRKYLKVKEIVYS
jgi:hypothetical protein